MNVSVTVSREKERTYMKTFTIDDDSNISVFPTPEHAEAAVGTGSQPFTSQTQLAELAFAWPAERLGRTQAFPVLTPAQINRIRPLGRSRKVHRGEILFEPNDTAVPFFVLLSGSMEIVQPTLDGERLRNPNTLLVAAGDQEGKSVPGGLVF